MGNKFGSKELNKFLGISILIIIIIVLGIGAMLAMANLPTGPLE